MAVQLTTPLDLWLKYWPAENQDELFLTTKILEYFVAKNVSTIGVTLIYSDIAAQVDDDGQRKHATIVGVNLDPSVIDHDQFATFIGVHP